MAEGEKLGSNILSQEFALPRSGQGLPWTSFNTGSGKTLVYVGRGQEVREPPGAVCFRGAYTDGKVELDVTLKLLRECADKHHVRSGSEDRGYRNNRQLGFTARDAAGRLPSRYGHKLWLHLSC